MQGKPLAEQEIGKLLLQETVSYAESSICRRKTLLHYFGEEYPEENCNCCDNCLHPKPKFEGRESLVLMLKVLKFLGDKFKYDYLINVLIGRNNALIKSYGHNKSEWFGVGGDQSRWTGEKEGAKISGADGAGEKVITQEMRQLAYDNWETTDDHGMQIYGIAKDQNGKEYFMMKNSWGEYGPYKGFWYVSKPYAAYKTMNIVINKNAIPADIRAKLGI